MRLANEDAARISDLVCPFRVTRTFKRGRSRRTPSDRSVLPLPNRPKETVMNLKRECHGRRRLHSSRALLASLALASASLNACGDNHGDDSAELQAILKDGDLTEVMRGMLMDPTTGSGGTTGAAGRGGPGTAGSFGAAGSMSGPGTAGSFGGGGTGMIPGPTRNFPGEAQGFWRFDDCFMERTELGDSSFFG